MNPTFIVIPVIASLIGWLTNFIAVKMLFHPRNEIKFLFFKIQGVFPKRQAVLAKRLGEVVANELFSSEDVTEKLNEGMKSPEVEKVLRAGISRFINETLPEKVPMIAMIMNPEFAEKIEVILYESVTPIMDKVLRSLSQEVQGSLNVQNLVEKRVSEFSSEKLESILFAIMKREFRFIELLGGVLGFMIGIMQLLSINLLGYG